MNKFKRMKRIIILFIALIFIFTAILYHYDHTNFDGYDQEHDKDYFNRIFHRFYFVICAMSSMGYGDVSPKSVQVKAITIIIQSTIILAVISELSQYEIYKFFNKLRIFK